MNAKLDGTDDYFDSRDVIERISEMELEYGPEAGDSIASVYAYAVQTPADAGARSEPGRGPRPARPGRRRRSPRRTRSPRSVSR